MVRVVLSPSLVNNINSIVDVSKRTYIHKIGRLFFYSLDIHNYNEELSHIYIYIYSLLWPKGLVKSTYTNKLGLRLLLFLFFQVRVHRLKGYENFTCGFCTETIIQSGATLPLNIFFQGILQNTVIFKLYCNSWIG